MPATSDLPGKRTDLKAPTLLARAGQAIGYVLTGVRPDAWFGPLQPLKPFAPAEQVDGRAFDYPVGWNIGGGPRIQSSVSFADLRAVADSCDLLRLAIETRKDQIAAKPWGVRVRFQGKGKAPEATPDQKARIETLTKFFKRPEPDAEWNSWVRALLEDMFVIDAVSIYKRRTRGGDMFALELLDGATIKPLIDDLGRTPLPPDPAYQQWLHGVPAADYSMDELLYAPRNRNTAGVYGNPPVQQVLITVNIAIRRALFQLDYYRIGSQPDAIISLPENWDMAKTKAFHDWWQSQLAGASERRQVRMIPGQFKYQETKAPPLKDEFDEWLARVICYAFSISPEPFIKSMNRATSESAHDRALEEGLTPLQDWIKSHLDRIIEVDFASPDLEFDFTDDRAQDPEKAAKVHAEYLSKGVLSIDDVREQIGEGPLGGMAAKPMVLTATGYVPIDNYETEMAAEAERQATAALQAEAIASGQVPPPGQPGAPAKGEEPGEGGPGPLDSEVPALEDGDEEEKAAKLAKRRAKAPRAPAKKLATARKSIARKLKIIFAATAEQAAAILRSRADKVAKAGPFDWIDNLDLTGLKTVVASTQDELNAVAQDAATAGLVSVGVRAAESELVNAINAGASNWAKDRSATLVTQVSESTRQMLRDTVSSGLKAGLTEAEIADNIEALNANVFSEERAELIARYEVGTANSGGALESFKAAKELGIPVKKAWLADDQACEVCQENQEAGAIELDETFPSGDDAPLAHPNCECSLIPITGDEED